MTSPASRLNNKSNYPTFTPPPNKNLPPTDPVFQKSAASLQAYQKSSPPNIATFGPPMGTPVPDKTKLSLHASKPLNSQNNQLQSLENTRFNLIQNLHVCHHEMNHNYDQALHMAKLIEDLKLINQKIIDEYKNSNGNSS